MTPSTTLQILKTTPLLCVESIEADLPFWIQALGFEKTVEVPHQGKLGFTILTNGHSELMLQSRASLLADLPAVGQQMRAGNACLYCEVNSIEAAIAAMKGVTLLVPLRKTFYGTQEVFVQAPDGTVLGLSAQV